MDRKREGWALRRRRLSEWAPRILYQAAELSDFAHSGLWMWADVVHFSHPFFIVYNLDDFEAQGAYNLVKKFDPSGERTIGANQALHLLLQ